MLTRTLPRERNAREVVYEFPNGREFYESGRGPGLYSSGDLTYVVIGYAEVNYIVGE